MQNLLCEEVQFKLSVESIHHSNGKRKQTSPSYFPGFQISRNEPLAHNWFQYIS
jgi:hypothetical protein